MSRLGKQPITIPAGVEVTFVDGVCTVKGPKATLTRVFTNDVQVSIADGVITLAPKAGSVKAKALWGTYAAHIHNMITGVTTGFTKKLEIEGVGYRAEVQGNKIKLSVGFSHPVELFAPEGVSLLGEKSLITVSGADIDAVGQFAADIRKVKKPEPYKGKGIHYVGEFIIRKQGKKGVA
jgi:large subunit ribosomal protein L6